MKTYLLPTFCYLSLITGLTIFSPIALANSEQDLLSQRTLYLQAINHLKHGRITRFKQIRKKLQDYPLYPYLIYEDIKRRLYTLPTKDVRQFLTDYGGTAVATRLEKRWLLLLGKKNKWSMFLDDYVEYPNHEKLRCYYLRALYNLGQKEEALDQVLPLWVAGKSQPKACDPLFQTWVSSGRLTEDLVWQRMTLALQARKYQLARYLLRFLPPKQLNKGQLFIKTFRKPARLKKTKKYREDSEIVKNIILTSIYKWARADAPTALETWRKYQAIHQFNETDTANTERRLALYLAKKFNDQASTLLDSSDPEYQDQELTKWKILTALRQLDWQKASQTMELLPDEARHKPRWKYWQGRALEQLSPKTLPPTMPVGEPVNLNTSSPPVPVHSEQLINANKLYGELAKTRNYYGFLAADQLGVSYTMEDESSNYQLRELERFQKKPAISRALEFYVLGLHVNARREWYHTVRQLNPEQLSIAAKLAYRWGWYKNAIQATIDGKEWNNLSVRFPLAYQDHFLLNAKKNNIDSNWLSAVARQESAFMPDAKSSAGALGILQLMPSTAVKVARKTGVKYRNSNDLLDPVKNIRLGSEYLGQLSRRFNNNRILASAAYNAGPHRVKKWQNSSTTPLPMDIWIETIPFDETRQYVQNVLTFTVIYGYRQGLEQSLLFDHELL